jgi:hypothetical protein
MLLMARIIIRGKPQDPDDTAGLATMLKDSAIAMPPSRSEGSLTIFFG